MQEVTLLSDALNAPSVADSRCVDYQSSCRRGCRCRAPTPTRPQRDRQTYERHQVMDALPCCLATRMPARVATSATPHARALPTRARAQSHREHTGTSTKAHVGTAIVGENVGVCKLPCHLRYDTRHCWRLLTPHLQLSPTMACSATVCGACRRPMKACRQGV